MQSCGCFLKGRKCSFVKVNPRKVAALDAFVTLLWDSGPALAQGWRRNALSPTAGALTQSLRASLQVVGTSKHLKAKDKRFTFSMKNPLSLILTILIFRLF